MTFEIQHGRSGIGPTRSSLPLQILALTFGDLVACSFTQVSGPAIQGNLRQSTGRRTSEAVEPAVYRCEE